MDNFPLLSFQFLFFFCWFWVAIYFSWYLPGRFFIGEKEKNSVTRLLLGMVLGITLWGLQAYILGYFHLRFLTYVYVVFFTLYYWQKHRIILHELFSLVVTKVKQQVFISLFIGIGLVMQLLPIANSGFLYRDGVHFYGVNAYDGVMHLAFINSIRYKFPPVEPGAFDHPMTNYHYWSDMILADLIRIWHLPISHTFFQFVPIIISIFTGIAAYKIIRILGFSRTAGLWSLFFLYFGGDAAYALMLMVYKKLSFAAPAIDNGVTQFLNMPHAMGKLLFITSLIPFHYFLKSKQTYWGIISILLFAVLVGIKIYFGLYAIMGFALVFTCKIVAKLIASLRKSFSTTSITKLVNEQRIVLILGIVLLFGALLIYLPPNKGSGGLGFYPLEWAKIFIGPGVLNWGNWWLRHQEYEAHHNIKGIAFLDTLAIIITLICVYGTRLLGLFPTKRVYKMLGWEWLVFFLPGLLIFNFLGMYTMQKSGGLNVFNFFVVGTVVLSLLSAILLDEVKVWGKNILITIVALSLIIVTIPRVIHEMQEDIPLYFHTTEDTKIISNDELEAFAYLRKSTPQNAIIQSFPTDPYDHKTPYVSYFSRRLTFLTGVGMQESHNQPLKYKEAVLIHLFTANHPQTFATDSLRRGISYIYLRKDLKETLPFSIDPHLEETVFENKSVIIYKLHI